MHESASSQICICGESPTFVTARGTLRRAGHFCEIQILFGARTRALSFAAPNLVFSLVLRPPPLLTLNLRWPKFGTKAECNTKPTNWFTDEDSKCKDSTGQKCCSFHQRKSTRLFSFEKYLWYFFDMALIFSGFSSSIAEKKRLNWPSNFFGE